MKHKEYCKGVREKSSRLEMPEEDKNILKHQNFEKQRKVHFVALVQKTPGCKHLDARNVSYIEKSAQHEVCGLTYEVVRSDGCVMGDQAFRLGEDEVEVFL